MKLPISVIVLTYNEEKNIRDCLESVNGWADEIFIIDSLSGDRTVEFARHYTDKIFSHPFENYARQRNWAQTSLPIKNDWVLHLDADERPSPQLVSEIKNIFSANVDIDGFMMPRKTIFRGRWIRHGGHYPSYHLRLFRKDKGKSEERYYDQNYIVAGKTAMLKGDLINMVTSDIAALIGKYKVNLEAREILYNNNRVLNLELKNNPIGRINWLRYNIYYKAPIFMRAVLYFLYRYFLRLGFLDGAEGLVFHFYQGFWFRFLVDMKIFELKYLKR